MSKRWPLGLSSIGIVLILALAAALGAPRLWEAVSRWRSPREALVTAVVRRTDLNVTMTAGGRVDSAEKTVIECELERLDFGARGAALVRGGSSTVLSVVADGTAAKKGDILCELDSSEYVEMLRQQQMAVEQARADHRQAELDLEVARLAVVQYKEGILRETLQGLSAQTSLAESTLERARDRLDWSRRMLDKGYVATSQLKNDELALRSAELKLKQGQTELDVFQRFQSPKTILGLEGHVLASESTFKYQTQRLSRQVEREKMLRLQIERCIIRAPHDGFVIYAIDDDKPIQIEEGMSVRQRQDLFQLPNLTKMVIKIYLHESMYQRVHPGQRARVRIDALPGQVVEGHVESIDLLATRSSSSGISYFFTVVTLDTIPRGLKPWMSAEVEIATERRVDVLAIPLGAYGFERGRDVCYVVSEHGIERRVIQTGQTTSEMVEVTEGLEEGEHVVLDPAQFDPGLEAISPFHTKNLPTLSEAEVR